MLAALAERADALQEIAARRFKMRRAVEAMLGERLLAGGEGADASGAAEG